MSRWAAAWAAAAAACYPVTVDPALPWHLPQGAGDCANLDSFRPIALARADAHDRDDLVAWDPPERVPVGYHDAVGRMVMAYARACGAAQVAALTERLVAFPTVSADDARRRSPGFTGAKALIQDFARRAGLGFITYGKNDDAWEVTLGSGPRRLAWVGHIDVVPPGDGWAQDPFRVSRRDGALWGRGVEDDKGPLAAALLTLFWLQQAGLHGGDSQLAVVMGTGEEGDWSGMLRYLKHAPPAEVVLSLDGTFPVVVAESGSVRWQLALDHPPSRTPARPGTPSVVAVEGGHLPTQIPGVARMTLEAGPGQDAAGFKGALAQAVAEENARRATAPFHVEVNFELDASRRRAVVEARGRAAHSAFPEDGYSALWPLASVASTLHAADRGAGKMLAAIVRFFDQDTAGEKLRLAFRDPMMGPLTVAVTELNADVQRSRMTVNLRRPRGLERGEFAARLVHAEALLRLSIDAGLHAAAPPDIAEPWSSQIEAPQLDALLQAWRAVTGRPGEPASLRGGTYARLYPHAVSFGPLMPGRPRTAHTPQEHMTLADLATMTELMLAATLRLAHPEARRPGRP